MRQAGRMARHRLVLGVLLVAVVLAGRVPLLGNGYGSDDDAWRNAVAALRMHAVGHYVPSRIPGFPVYEGLLVPLIPFGAVATNALSVFAGLVAAWFFLRAARRGGAKSPVWLAAAFCFSAPVWVEASQTMDYAVGLAFLLASYDAWLRRKYVPAGVLLALAAGCRATLGVLVLPALAGMALRRERGRTGLAFVAATVLPAAVVFLPPLLSPATRGMEGQFEAHVALHHATPAAVPDLLRRVGVFLFGKPGLIVLGLGLVAAASRVYRRRGSPRAGAQENGEGPADRRLPETAFEASGVIVVTVLFLLMPYEPAYMMPALPLVLLLVGRVLSRSWTATLALALATAVFMTPVLETRRVVPGRLFQEVRARRADLARTAAQEALRPPEPTVYVIGRFAVHRLLLRNRSLRATEAAWAPFHASGVALWSPDGRKGYAADLDPPDRVRLERGGYRIVDLSQ